MASKKQYDSPFAHIAGEGLSLTAAGLGLATGASVLESMPASEARTNAIAGVSNISKGLPALGSLSAGLSTLDFAQKGFKKLKY